MGRWWSEEANDGWDTWGWEDAIQICTHQNERPWWAQGRTRQPYMSYLVKGEPSTKLCGAPTPRSTEHRAGSLSPSPSASSLHSQDLVCLTLPLPFRFPLLIKTRSIPFCCSGFLELGSPPTPSPQL